MVFHSRFCAAAWLTLVSTLIARPAVADDRERPESLVGDDARRPFGPPNPETFRVELHGELQLRGQFQTKYALDPTVSAVQDKPGLAGRSMGQGSFATQWLRLTPKVFYRDTWTITAQADVFTGLVLGDTSVDVGADRAPRDNRGDLGNFVLPRALYLDWKTSIGLLRVGMQPNHWGMGILANDGDHPTLFGDYRMGQISERILFGTKPFGKDTPFTVALAGDLVYRDANARLYRGDVALQGVLAASYEQGLDQFGLFAVYRYQTRDRSSFGEFANYTEGLDVLALDLAGRFARPVPGYQHSYVYGAIEAAVTLGDTNLVRTADQVQRGTRVDVRAYGGAAKLGFVLGAVARDGDCKADAVDANKRPYGKYVAEAEVGYASGDSDPYDNTQKRFSFDANHRVGLVLFDEVLRWHTARASVAGSDPRLSNASRPTPGLDLLPSNGGVFGATYINPTFLFRPRSWLDLKVGAVIAHASADLVSPYRLATEGNYVNYRGGDARARDLGVEFDAGVDSRMKLANNLLFQSGAQAGVLLPGRALADAQGALPANAWLLQLRAGLQF